MPTIQEKIDFILGPQAQLSNSYFDLTQVAMAKKLGAMCPAVPPTDPTALNNYAMGLQYYDLPKSLYIVHRRTSDSLIQADAHKTADSWWQHPWIGKGLARPWPDNASPPPRHAGIGGLILRALDGKPEYWDFCVEYTKAFLNTYHLWRLNNAKIHVDIREGAFTFHYATWLAYALPDSYPLQSGGVATNGAATRAQLHASLEKITIDYYERLQKTSPCGCCWLYDAEINGISLRSFTQPFTVGLLLLAFADFQKITTNLAVKESLKGMILRAARHLYLDGPYRLNDPVPYDPSKWWRCFWYLWHGGTLANPTEFEKGGWSLPGTTKSDVQDARQSIGPVIAIYGKAYELSGGEPIFLEAAKELWAAAYGDDNDTIRTYFDTDGKGFNQHCARAGSLWPWIGTVAPIPTPAPVPTPIPAPTPAPPPPAPEPSKDTTAPIAAITQPVPGATLSGKVEVKVTVSDNVAVKEVYLFVDDINLIAIVGILGPYSFTLDTTRLTDGSHVMYVRAWDTSGNGGDSPKITFTVKNATIPAPVPVESLRKIEWPKQISKQNLIIGAQKKEGYCLKGIIEGIKNYGEFEKHV